ncbi:Uncharacterised protein [Yersinia frederiksenii]|nr:Uncharacterised protein [Yersinia frederiksenii]
MTHIEHIKKCTCAGRHNIPAIFYQTLEVHAQKMVN